MLTAAVLGSGGVFQATFDVGDRVEAGQAIGWIGTEAVLAPLSGWLRGMTHDAARVHPGVKIVEVDALGPPQRGVLGERPQRIAAGVLQAVAGQS